MCRGDQGFLTLYARGGEDGTLIQLQRRITRGLRANDCGDAIARTQGMARSLGIGQYIPRLELPEPLDERNSYGIQGNSSRGSDYSSETRTSVSTDWSLADLHTHFAAQILEQGWEEDVSASSELMATSGWARDVDADTRVFGKLTVISVGDDSFQLSFEIFRRGIASPDSN